MQEKLKRLSLERLTEAEDFIDFLLKLDWSKRLMQTYEQASEDVFKKDWDNDDDVVYDNI
jgi:hypothetical protein